MRMNELYLYVSYICHGGAVSWHTHLTLTLNNLSLQRDYDLLFLSELKWLQEPGQQSQYSYHATRWTLQGLIPHRRIRFSSFPRYPHRLWGSPSLLFNGYQRPFTQWYRGHSMMLINHLHLVCRLRKLTATPPLLCYQGVCTGRASPFPNKTTETDSKYSNQGEWDGWVPHTSEM
jgi:hypothetical protein